jgi:negative regulator of sigma-B (phosphoserine phosphatase)
MVCRLEGERIEGCGVGNVDLRSYGTPVPVVLTPGVVGRSLPRQRLFAAELKPGDRFVIFSDGISARFDGATLMRMPISEACRSFMDLHRRAHDDATVLLTHVEA